MKKSQHHLLRSLFPAVFGLCACAIPFLQLSARGSEMEFAGTWKSGFKFLSLAKLGVGAFLSYEVTISETEIAILERSFGNFLGVFVDGSKFVVKYEIRSFRQVQPVPVGAKGVVPDALYFLRVKPKDVLESELSVINVAKANSKQACGLSEWVPGQTRSVFTTRCVTGEKESEDELPLALKDGRMALPFTVKIDPLPKNTDEPAPPEEIDEDYMFDLGQPSQGKSLFKLEEVNFDFALTRRDEGRVLTK